MTIVDYESERSVDRDSMVMSSEIAEAMGSVLKSLPQAELCNWDLEDRGILCKSSPEI